MELLLYIITAWFIVTYLVVSSPKNDLVINIILYMLLLISTVSISTSMSYNIGLIDFTKDKIKFVSLIVYRNVILPMALVIFGSIFNKQKTYTKKILSIAPILFFTLSIEFINLQLRLYSYVKWNFILTFLLYSFYIFTAAMLNKMLYAFRKRREQN